MEFLSRAQSHGPTLIQLIARISGTEPPTPSHSLSDRLGHWIDWRQAVALSAALAAQPASHVAHNDRRPPGDDGECARVRAALVSAIENDRAFAPVGADASLADAAFYRQRYLTLQQVMEAEIRHLRGRLRSQLAQQEALLGRLAAVDAVMEQALGSHERALLAPLPELLGAHFERLKLAAPDAGAAAQSGALTPSPPWQDVFRHDMRQLLLAELDMRMQPAQGLLAALRTTATGHHGH